MMISKSMPELIGRKNIFFNMKIDFYRLDTNNIRSPNKHKTGIHHSNYDVTKVDSMDNVLEKQVKDTLNGFDVQQEIGASLTSAPGSLARMASVIVPYKKSDICSTIP